MVFDASMKPKCLRCINVPSCSFAGRVNVSPALSFPGGAGRETALPLWLKSTRLNQIKPPVNTQERRPTQTLCVPNQALFGPPSPHVSGLSSCLETLVIIRPPTVSQTHSLLQHASDVLESFITSTL